MAFAYCGTPAGRQAFLAAHRTLSAEGAGLTGTGEPPGRPSGCVMLAAVERYVIRGGREGYNRLLLLARASWPDTAALFGRAGIRPGMTCVDLGCGVGGSDL